MSVSSRLIVIRQSWSLPPPSSEGSVKRCTCEMGSSCATVLKSCMQLPPTGGRSNAGVASAALRDPVEEAVESEEVGRDEADELAPEDDDPVVREMPSSSSLSSSDV